MPAKSKRQQRAACADLNRKQQGKAPKTMTGASTKQLRDFCKKRK